MVHPGDQEGPRDGALPIRGAPFGDAPSQTGLALPPVDPEYRWRQTRASACRGAFL